MNYRHAFHAGNFADVMKHIVLARVLEHLKQKPAPFRAIDLHAGAGLYDLMGEAAGRTGEWRDGVGRLYREGTCEADPLAGDAEDLIGPWRKALAAVNDGARLARYPGSPEIVRRLAREGDRFVFNELHPEDRALLAARFARERRSQTTAMDAGSAAKALLPPPERRGLVLFDPPYERKDEVTYLLEALAQAHRRFATGVFLVWYPIKLQAEAAALARRVLELKLGPTLRAELILRRPDSGRQLNGSGLLIVNPPWKLDAELQVILPRLAERLADPASGPQGGWSLAALPS